MKTTFLASLATALALVVPVEVLGQELSTLSAADIAFGERLYAARCGRCHGLEGFGGEGPALARPFLNYARDDEMLVSVIRNGIPGTGMPSDWALSGVEARQVAAHVRALGRVAVAESPTGDPARGQSLYRGKGECVACHGPNGTGNQFGPDLTDVSARRNLEFIRESIVDPGAALPLGLNGVMSYGFRGYLPVRAVKQIENQEVNGHRVNESTFTILVRDRDGGLHSFHKTALAELTKQFGRSVMPSYRRRLSDDEVDDLVAYLFSLREIIP